MKNVLALLADFANGIFAVLLAGIFFLTETEWWFFLIGILLSSTPDIDALPELIKRRKVASSAEYTKDHRTFLHYPVVAISLGTLATWFFGYFGLVWLIAMLLHLVNDMYGTGWGIQLFWPFNKFHYKFLSRRVNRMKKNLIRDNIYESLPVSERRLNLVTSWSSDELPDYISKWGQDNWISEYYGKLNATCLVEYTLFLTAVVLAVLTLL